MSVFLRSLLAIVIIAVIIIAFGVGTGIVFVEQRVRETVSSDMRVVAGIADRYISDNTRLLFSEASLLALGYASEKGGGLSAFWEKQPPDAQVFIGLALFDSRRGRMDAAGQAPAPAEIFTEDYIQKALAGSVSISPPSRDPDGQLKFYVSVPLNGQALTATLPGSYFSGLLSNFKIWETGRIFFCDRNGGVIAHEDAQWIQADRGFTGMAETSRRRADIAEVIRRMIRGETGHEWFFLDNVEYICAFGPLSASGSGWSLGAVAPVSESPLSKVRTALVFVGVVCMLLDIIAACIAAHFIKIPFDKMADLEQTAEAASSAKSNFLASMSHEMRTPLNAVIGLSELALGEELPAAAREHLEKVHNSGMTLLGIVNDILDLSKIGSGKFELVPAEFDLPSLINDTIALNIVRIGSKPITFKLDIDGELPARLIGDELRIKQIFNKLLSNAFKYTAQGDVNWSLSSKREGNYVWLTGSVRDSGAGIKPEDMDSLFADYRKLDIRKNRKIEGVGLGLSITKQMVDLMHGSIGVESEYGKGSVFTVRLRQDYVSDQTIGDEVAANLKSFHYADSKRSHNEHLVRVWIPYARVLVVDDVATNLAVARGILKPYGMRVDCVNSGKKAVALVEKAEVKYSAIFMDHMMPEMDGIEAARIIRQEIGTEYAKTVPLIALTANAIIGTEDLFLQNGFQAFLSKPIDVMAMDTAIRRWVRDKSKEKGLVPPEGGGRSPETNPRDSAPLPALFAGQSIPGMDFAGALGRFGGSEETYLDILKAFVQSTPALLETLRVPAAATLPAYAITVHGIKGGSRNIGAAPLGDRAEALEKAAKAGDFDFVRANTAAFIRTAESLLGSLSALLARAGAERAKPKKAAPDPELMTALLEACRVFDMDGVDGAMEQLNQFDYEQDAELIAWLNEQVSLAGFKQIAARLGKAPLEPR